jgi:hypothetical protein
MAISWEEAIAVESRASTRTATTQLGGAPPTVTSSNVVHGGARLAPGEVLRRLAQARTAVMHGRTFTVDSAQLLREARDERTQSQ